MLETSAETRLSASLDSCCNWLEAWDEASRKPWIAVMLWLRETLEAGSWAAEEKAEKAWSSWPK